MSNSDIVTQTTKDTVVGNYIPTGKCSDNYQDIDALAKEFLDLLCHQGYDDRITFDDEEGMVVNLRTNLELLNDYHFTDTEWCRFFNDCIANPNEHILEKSRKLQGDFVQVLTRDDGTTKNIILINKNDIAQNHLEVLDHSLFMVEEGEKRNMISDYTILVNGLPLVHVELRRRDITIQEAFSHIDTYQKEASWARCRLFEYVQIFVLSNGSDTKYYSNSTRKKAIIEAEACIEEREKTFSSFEHTSHWADSNNVIIPDLLGFTQTFFASHTLINLLTKYCLLTSENELLIMSPSQIAAAEHNLIHIKDAKENTTAIEMSNQRIIPLIVDEIEKQKDRTGKTETIDVIEPVIDAISERLGTTRAAVKEKAVSLGFPEAAGAFVPIYGDRTAAPYCRSDGKVDIQYTYTIGFEELRSVFDNNKELKKKVEEGRFLYVDGHLVFNSRKYCSEDHGKLMLTDYARSHIEQCCIAFAIEMPHAVTPNVFCELTTLEAKRTGPRVIGGITYIKGVNNGTIETQNAEFDALFSDTYKLIAECNNDLAHNLELVRTTRKVTVRAIADEMHYDEGSLSRFFTGERKPRAELLAYICIALNMPYILSRRIFEDSPNRLDLSSEKGKLLDFALQTMFGHPLEEVGELLKRHGVI